MIFLTKNHYLGGKNSVCVPLLVLVGKHYDQFREAMPLNHSTKYSELTDEQFLLIGKLLIEFSNIEFLLGMLLSRLLMTSEFLGRTYVEQMMASKKLEAIDNAIDIHVSRYGNKIISKTTTDEIKSLTQTIKSIQSLRNKFAHYCWTRTTDDEIFGTKFSGKVPKKNKSDSINIKNAQLKSEYYKAYNAVEDLNRIIYFLPEIEEERFII